MVVLILLVLLPFIFFWEQKRAASDEPASPGNWAKERTTGQVVAIVLALLGLTVVAIFVSVIVSFLSWGSNK